MAELHPQHHPGNGGVGHGPQDPEPGEHSPHDQRGHAHEHPEPFTRLPLVDERLVDALAAALPEADPLLRALVALERSATMARALAAGAEVSSGLLNQALAGVDAAQRELTDAGFADPKPGPDHDCHHHHEHGEVPWARRFSRSAVIDLLLGVTYAEGGDSRRVRQAVEPFVDVLRTVTTALDAAADTPTPLALLPAAGVLTPHADAFAAAVDDLVQRWLDGNPVADLLERCEAITLNDAIGALEPAAVAVGAKLTLVAGPGESFGKEPPADVAVLGRDGRTPFPLVSWAEDRVVVSVPAGAADGHVFFAPHPSTDADAWHDWQTLLAREWMTTALPLLTRAGLRRPEACRPKVENHLAVLKPPALLDAKVVGADGVRVQSPAELAEAPRPLRVRWAAVDAEPGASVQLVLAGSLITDVPASAGFADVPPGYDSWDQLADMDLRIAGPGGGQPPDTPDTPGHDHPHAPAVPIVPQLPLRLARLRLDPPRVSIGVPTNQDERRHGRPPAMRAVAIHFPRTLRAPATFTAESSNPRVELILGPSVLAPGTAQTSMIVCAHAYDRDRPGEPCAVVSVLAEDGDTSYSAELEVWVAPIGGKWELVGPEAAYSELRDGNTGTVGPVEPAGRIPGEAPRLSVAVHATLFHDGKMLFFAAPRADIGDVENVETERWNPRTMTSEGEDAPPPGPRNLFCAGHCHLPDGRLLIAGGQARPVAGARASDVTLHIYNPYVIDEPRRSAPGEPLRAAGRRWQRLDDMSDARWYPTCTVLPDGRVLIVSGSHLGAYAPHVYPWGHVVPTSAGWRGGDSIYAEGGSSTRVDIVDPRGRGTVVRFPRARFLDHEHDTYPYMALLPGGPGYPSGAIMAIERSQVHLFAYQPASSESPLGPQITRRLEFAARRTFPIYGSGVLLPLDGVRPADVRYLILGGGDERDRHLNVDAEATDTAEIVPFDPSRPLNAQPLPRPTRTRMNHRRFMSDAVLLADGTVLVCGGAARGMTSVNSRPVRQAELFDPVTETFTAVDTAMIERRYHSTHVLLPDGTVQATGSTGGYPPGPTIIQQRVEVYRPSYLWRGPRPVITSAPFTFRYGREVWIDTPDAGRVTRVALVKLASVTHANNMGQRYVRLPLLRSESHVPALPTDHVTVSAPSDGTVAPPGPYHLFLLDELGVPSLSRVVFVGP